MRYVDNIYVKRNYEILLNWSILIEKNDYLITWYHSAFNVDQGDIIHFQIIEIILDICVQKTTFLKTANMIPLDHPITPLRRLHFLTHVCGWTQNDIDSVCVNEDFIIIQPYTYKAEARTISK